MKKIWIILLVASFHPALAEPCRIPSGHPVYQLINKYQKDTSQIEKNAHLTAFEKSFFADTSFFAGPSEKDFLVHVACWMNNGSEEGVFRNMTYTRMVFINGRSHIVRYDYQSNGKNAILVRRANFEGKTMEAVYQFDISQKSLKVRNITNRMPRFGKEYRI